ncbi:MAG: DMT family transporter [Deltaproteobacteria bacterium]|nr:DMT family transporter [Deltaproteobacteria bacterium]
MVDPALARERLIARLQVMAGASMISFSAVFVKLAHVGPTTAGFYRVLFGGLGLAALVLIKGEPLWAGRRFFLTSALCGLMFALDLGFWHRSIHFIGPGLATLLSNFQVFFLAAFGILVFKEKLTWRLGLAIPLSMTGLYLVAGLNWHRLGKDYHWGVVFSLITAVCYAVYILVLRWSRAHVRRLPVEAGLAIISFTTAGILGLFSVLTGESLAIPDGQTWAALIGYGLFGQVFGWVFISKGLPRTDSSQVGLFLLIQPTLAFIWDLLFFSRPTTAVEALGACLALGAIYLGVTR